MNDSIKLEYINYILYLFETLTLLVTLFSLNTLVNKMYFNI